MTYINTFSRLGSTIRPVEARYLLRAVDRQSSLIAKRDYAFLLTALLTGLPEADLHQLRWSQLDLTPQAVLLTSSGAASARELPPPTWIAPGLARSHRSPRFHSA